MLTFLFFILWVVTLYLTAISAAIVIHREGRGRDNAVYILATSICWATLACFWFS